MAHYAFIDPEQDNMVVEVIVGRDEDDLIPGIDDWETYYASKRDGLICKRTSYNTHRGEHKLGGEPLRGNFAGVGRFYLPEEDIFVSPKKYPSWVLNVECACYEPPIAMPDDGQAYVWDESVGEWSAVEEGTE